VNKGERLIPGLLQEARAKRKARRREGAWLFGDKGLSGFLRFSQKPTLRTLSKYFLKKSSKNITIHMNFSDLAALRNTEPQLLTGRSDDVGVNFIRTARFYLRSRSAFLKIG